MRQSPPICDSILLNQLIEFNNRNKKTIKEKHNLAEIEILKILHDLKCPISVYDTIGLYAGRHVGTPTSKVIFDSSSKYKLKT